VPPLILDRSITRKAAVDIDVRNPYPAPVATVIARFADPEFVTARAAGLDHTHLEILECGPHGDGYRIRYRREVPVTVPAFAAKVLTPRTTVEQDDVWTEHDAETETWSGTWRVTARGLPVDLHGAIALAPEGAGSIHHITGSLTVTIPLIGRRLHGILLADTMRTIAAEHTFGIASFGDPS
jgi:hypothetical protein